MPKRFTFVPFLAALVAAPLVACSSADTTGSGGSAGTSASTSASTGDGGSTPAARVIVRDHGDRPAVGVDVLVHDPQGLTTQQTKTDATGAAMVNLVEGGGVTALYKTSQGPVVPKYAAVSVVGLAAGAEVRLVADIDPTPEAPLPMALTLKGVPPLLPKDWDIILSCYPSLSLSETSVVYDGCVDSASYDLVAFLAGGDKRIVFAAQPNQPGKSVPFLLDPAKAEAVPQVEVTLTAAPAGAASLRAILFANRPEGGRTQVGTNQGSIQPGALLKVPRLPVSAGGSFDLAVAVTTAEGALNADFPFTADKLPTMPLAWSPLAVPYATSTGKIAGTAQRPEVPWAIPPGSMPADAVRIALAYVVAQHQVDWTLYVAAGVGATARFPEIPAAFPGWAPEAGSAAYITTDHIDVAGTASLLAGVNADFDRTGSAWSTTSVTASVP